MHYLTGPETTETTPVTVSDLRGVEPLRDRVLILDVAEGKRKRRRLPEEKEIAARGRRVPIQVQNWRVLTAFYVLQIRRSLLRREVAVFCRSLLSVLQ